MSIKNTIKRHGFVKAIPYAACRLIQRFALLDITHLMILDASDSVNVESQDDIEFRFLSRDEVVAFAADPTNDIDAALAPRIDSGYDYCFAALDDGRLAGYCWLARHSIEAKHNAACEHPASGIAMSYGPEYAFRYKGFTHPDYRGRRIYQRVSHHASIALQQLGIRYILSTAEVVNYGAIKSSYRCGYRYLGHCILVGFRRWSLIRSPRTDISGLVVGKRAVTIDRDAVIASDESLSGELPSRELPYSELPSRELPADELAVESTAPNHAVESSLT